MALGFFAVLQFPVYGIGREKKAAGGVDPSGRRAIHATAAGHDPRGPLDKTELCRLDQW